MKNKSGNELFEEGTDNSTPIQPVRTVPPPLPIREEKKCKHQWKVNTVDKYTKEVVKTECMICKSSLPIKEEKK